jgi:hypothetical protein
VCHTISTLSINPAFLMPPIFLLVLPNNAGGASCWQFQGAPRIVYGVTRLTDTTSCTAALPACLPAYLSVCLSVTVAPAAQPGSCVNHSRYWHDGTVCMAAK